MHVTNTFYGFATTRKKRLKETGGRRVFVFYIKLLVRAKESALTVVRNAHIEEK
jgi:hypothetical protein